MTEAMAVVCTACPNTFSFDKQVKAVEELDVHLHYT